jgi:hypothetical protein
MRNESGQAAITMTLSLVVLMGTLGFVTDLGWGYYKQQSAQSAAEAAALAGAAYATANGSTCGTSGVNCTTTPTDCSSVSGTSAFETACEYAAANGFTSGSNGAHVTLTAGGSGSPPGSSGLTVNYWVSANVTQSLFQTFSAVFGHNSLNIGSAVTAASLAGPSSGTVYVLGSGPNTVTTSAGSGATIAAGSNIYVNSTSSSAVVLKGTDSVTCTGGGQLHVCGGCQKNGATVSPAPDTGCASHADPYSSMQPPSYNRWNCDYSSNISYSSGTHTLNPGHYCGNISISGSANVTFSAGVYEMDGNLSVNTTTGSCNGTGTTFYLTSNGYGGGGQCNMTAGTVNLTAPTSGTYQGIAIYQDRNNSNNCTMTCGSAQKISGVVYAPSAAVSHCGGSAGSAPNQTIVCNKIQYTGSTRQNVGSTTAYTCTPGVLVR